MSNSGLVSARCLAVRRTTQVPPVATRTAAVADAWVGLAYVTLCVCASVCVRVLEGKQLELSTSMIKLRRLIVDSSRSAKTASIDPEVKKSKVKVTQLLNTLPAWVCMSMDCSDFPVT